MDQPAARLLDQIEHTEAKTGFLAGALLGLAAGVAIVAVTVATGGAALAVVAAVGAGVATTGGGALLGQSLGETSTSPSGPLSQVGSPNVQVNSRPAVRAVLDAAMCTKHSSPPARVAQGSQTVQVNGKPAARKTELTECSGKIAEGATNVVFGGPTVTVLPISPEVPTWMTSLATAMVWVGSAVALGAGALAAAAASGVCGLVAFAGETVTGMVGGAVGSKVLGDVGGALFGERGRIVGEALGGFLGGFAGAKLGGRMTAGHPVDVASGELFTEHVDFAVPGALPLVWRRTWISSSTRGGANRGPLGEGWHHPFDAALASLPDGGGMAARLADGRYALFAAPTPLRPSLNAAEGLVLAVDRGGAYRLTDYDGVAHEFGPAGRDGVRPLARVRDPNGNAITLERLDGRLVALTDSAGRRFAVESDALGRITAVDGPHPEWSGRTLRLVAYEYDGRGDLVRAEDARGAAFTYRYDNHLLVEEVRPAGVAFQFVWDDAARGRGARCVDTWGRRPSDAPGRFYPPVYRAVLAYDEAARTTVVTNGEGARRRYRWNDRHLVEEAVDPLGHATRATYDAAGRVVAEQGPGGSVRQVYDTLGRLTTRVDAAGTTRLAYAVDAEAYDRLAQPLPLGRVARVTGADGAERAFAYDARGNLASETDPTGRTTAYARDGRGLVTEARDALGVAARFAWSPAGELVAEYAGAAGAPRRRYTHDRLGRVASVQRGRDLPLRIRRDGAGNVTSVTRGDDGVVALEYDPDGRVTLHRDPLGRTTRWRYDGLPFPVERVNADGGRVRYAYSTELELIALTNPKGERYRLAYDAAGRLTEEVGFDGRALRYACDAAGRLVATDDAGRVTRYVRDAAGRLVEKQFADGSAHRYAWDAAGRLARAESPDAVVSYVYDAAGRVVEERQAAPDRGELPLHYRYDARGRLAETVLPDGRTIAVEYGADGDLFAAVSLAGEELARVERDEAGREVARQAGSVRQIQEFDPQGRLVRQAGEARGRAVFARRYGYDAADQITRIDDGARGVRTYQYDACERLLGVGGAAPEAFVVDPAGNILARDAAAPHGDAAPGDRLLRYRDGEEERTFAYDAHGNRVAERRTRRGAAAAEVAYAYGADNQLREVRRAERDGGRQVTRFGYDALGRRVWKATARLAAGAAAPPAGVEPAAAAPASGDIAAREPHAGAWCRTVFVWDGDVLLGESDRPSEDPLATVYAYEPGTLRPLATAKRDGYGAGAAVYRYHLDHLGTPQELTDTGGALAWAARHDAWGTGDVGGVAQPLRFPGQYADVETGLHYNRHRYYSPAEARFTAQDPIRLDGGINLAMYAPNPVQWADPLGLANYPTNVDFTGHPDLFPVTGDQKNIVQITMQGSRTRDFTESFKASGISRADASGYTWHHVHDFDPNTGRTTMQLVKTPTHEATLPHKGSAAQFAEHFGVQYDSPEAVRAAEGRGWLQGRKPKAPSGPCAF